jgi:MFS family permease
VINADLLSRYQSRAFLLLPMCFNIGVIIGPILGGLLADPAGSYPDMFGEIGWLLKFPYAPPNILSACFLLTAAIGVFLGLEEVESPKYAYWSLH